MYANVPQLLEEATELKSYQNVLSDYKTSVANVLSGLSSSITNNYGIRETIRGITSDIEFVCQRLYNLGITLEDVVELYANTEQAIYDNCEGSYPKKASEEKKNTSIWAKLAIGLGIAVIATIAVVATGGVAAAVAGSVAAKIAVGAATGAMIGGVVGGLTSGIASKLTGGSFEEGFADGVLWGSIGGAIGGIVGPFVSGAKAAVVLGLDLVVDTGIYLAQKTVNNEDVTLLDIGLNAVISLGVMSFAMVGSKFVSKAIKNIKSTLDDTADTASDNIAKNARRNVGDAADLEDSVNQTAKKDIKEASGEDAIKSSKDDGINTVDKVSVNIENRLNTSKENINNPPFEILSDVDLKEISEEALKKCNDAGLSNTEINNLRMIKNGEKPAPNTYLEKSYIENHLDKFQENGCYKIIPDKRGEPSGTIGLGQDDLYVINGNDVNLILSKANGDPRVIEKELAMPNGYLGDNPYLIRADEVTDLRMSTGNEVNAWQDEWCPAGVTRAGIDEAVINPLEKGEYSYRNCFGDNEWKK